jgi:hypothetical protein
LSEEHSRWDQILKTSEKRLNLVEEVMLHAQSSSLQICLSNRGQEVQKSDVNGNE